MIDIFEEMVSGSGAGREITISRGYGELEGTRSLMEDTMTGKTTEEE